MKTKPKKVKSNELTSSSIYPKLVGKPTDYSKNENWMIKDQTGTKDVDVIYLLPTIPDKSITGNIYPINDHMRTNATSALERAKVCFADHANMYAPLIRQISETTAFKIGLGIAYEQAIYSSVARTDAYAALDYYFKHYNKNKPFILVGISHGGYTFKIVLQEYMKIHPDYYDRMIAAYLIGVNVNKQYLKNNPHIKPAQGETDTHVVIAWNTEGPNPTMVNQLLWDEPYCINPLNWKTDDTKADISQNLWTYDSEAFKKIPGVADAQIDLKRHVIVTTTPQNKGYQYLPKEWVIAGDVSYHFFELNFWAGNIYQNVKKRIDAWFNK